MNVKKIILVGYKKRSGKDTFVSMLKEEIESSSFYTVETCAFADAIKIDTANVFDTEVDVLNKEKDDTTPFKMFRRKLITMFSKLLDVPIKVIDRSVLTNVGTLVRETNRTRYTDIVNDSVRDTTADIFIITDFRFKHESIPGALTVNIARQSVISDSKNQHVSETELDDFVFDIVIDNNGTLDDLRTAVKDNLIHFYPNVGINV